MRPLRDMDSIQIEITNACVNTCSNCTRFCGHHRQPFFMSLEQFRLAVDSLVDFPRIVGIMGGEPLLHPRFGDFCRYLHERIPPQRCGLWSTFPRGGEHYARLITETFGNVLLNDHSFDAGIPHVPILLRARDCFREEECWYLIHHCIYQNAWSASITPQGAYFCEVAAALDILLDLNRGWPVVPGWWEKSPYHFTSQMEAFCLNCGGALRCCPRMDHEGLDDLSPWWLEKLRQLGSPKINAGKYRLYDGGYLKDNSAVNTFRKSEIFFHKIAAKYGITLVTQPNGFLRPVL